MTDYPSGAEMLFKGKKVEEGVEYIIKKYPQALGDYRILDWRFCSEFTGVRISFTQFVQLRSCPSFDTIHRRYREVREKLGLGPTPRVRVKRYNLQEAYRNHYSTGLKLTDFMNEE